MIRNDPDIIPEKKQSKNIDNLNTFNISINIKDIPKKNRKLFIDEINTIINKALPNLIQKYKK